MRPTREPAPGLAVFDFLGAIDMKTQSLLTHVSIMMTILSIIPVGTTDAIIRRALGIEVFVYLLITLGCLRSVFILGSDPTLRTKEHVLHATLREVARRRHTYRVSLIAIIVVTVAFMATIGLHAWLRLT